MVKETNDFLDFLQENDPFGLLKVKQKKSPRASRSVLLNNFEEIVNFFEEKNREPQNSASDVKEFQLYCRLKQIRTKPEFVQQLKEFDLYGLLRGEGVQDISFEDLLGDDPLNLLGGDFDESIFKLNNVRRSDRIAPEYIARRKFCQNFEIYESMFETLHHDLENGNRRLAIYHSGELLPERFYVLGGIILYLKSIDGSVANYQYISGERQRYDGRTEIIFDNGTTSDMLYRSLDKALQKDGYAITNYEENIAAAENVNERDKSCGFLYVLKSHHEKLRNVHDIYKIGSTTSSVTERIKNAVKEPTYLYAGVEVIGTFRCYNMSPRELEDKIHTFFDKVRLNINIPDERGAIISPREWFCVKFEAIGEAIELILRGRENDYVYDPSVKKIVAKQTLIPGAQNPTMNVSITNSQVTIKSAQDVIAEGGNKVVNNNYKE